MRFYPRLLVAPFLSGITSSDRRLAIKKLLPVDNDPRASYLLTAEVGEVTRLNHPNIIRILGLSNDQENNVCLIYPYMSHGNMEEALESQILAPRLTFETRLQILIGVAEAVKFLHVRPKALLHRDIKTPNILLDDNMQPKVSERGG